MPKRDETTRDKTRRQLIHDIQGCLHAISMGLEILKAAREDESQFDEVCQSIAAERKNAARFLDELQRTTGL